ANGHHLIRVDAPVRLFAVREFLDQLLDGGHPRCPTDEDDLIEFGGRELRVLERGVEGATVFSVRSAVSCSNLAREILISRCLGPFWSAVMKGRLTSVSIRLDSSIFAFSAASVSRCKACRSLRRSIPCSFLNSSAM